MSSTSEVSLEATTGSLRLRPARSRLAAQPARAPGAALGSVLEVLLVDRAGLGYLLGRVS